MNRFKVCHIMHDGSGQGGGATFALAYFPGYLAEFDTLAIVGDDGNLAERLQARGVRTLTLPMARPARFIFSGPKLWNICGGKNRTWWWCTGNGPAFSDR